MSAVVFALVAAGVVAHQIARGDHRSSGVVAALTTTSAKTPLVVVPETSTAPSADLVDLNLMSSLSFVDAAVGFAVAEEAGQSIGRARTPIFYSLVRTGDGGRTWQRVSPLPANYDVHFENASDGVAWGAGPTKVTRDGGRHWSELPRAPKYLVTAWLGGRMWAVQQCRSDAFCGTSLLFSDDVGMSWRGYGRDDHRFAGTYEDAIGIVPAMVATSRSTVHVLETTDRTPVSPVRIATTHNGGATWQYDPAPCLQADKLFFASNDESLLMECVGDPVFRAQVFVSTDQGRSWTPVSGESMDGRYLPPIVGFGSRYLAESRYSSLSSANGGRSWQPVPIRNGASGVGFYPLPGIGVWAAVFGLDVPRHAARIWFSADGAHWEKRAES